MKLALRWRMYAYWCLPVNPFFDATPLPGAPKVLCQRQEREGNFYMEGILPHGPAAIVPENNP